MLDTHIHSPLTRRKDHQKTITLALLTTGAIDPNNRAIWNGVFDAAKEASVNLICYPGRLLNSPVEFESQRNVIYQMLDKNRVDGLVVMGGLNAWLNMDQTYVFLHQFAPRPVATTGIVLEGIPGVSVDNYHGMMEVITHLVSVHNRRRIAFIRGQAGHQEAKDRYQAYLDVLKNNNIPFDPNLVYQGNFKESGGVAGARCLVEERRASFDALVAASDNMAIGAIKTLQALGIRVPLDVAVAGLNGEEQGLVINPPLTTALLHFYEQAYQATVMVLAMLDGKEVPSKVVLPTRMVARQSCGCADPLVTHAHSIPHTEKMDSFTDEIRLLDDLVFGDANFQLQMPPEESVHHLFPPLLRSFLDEIRSKGEGEFLGLFSNALQKTGRTNESFPRWHEIISIMRQFAISQLSDPDSRLRVENLVQQMRIILGESSRRFNAYQVLKADEKLHLLGEASQSLNLVNNVSELSTVLAHWLYLFKIPCCYLFLYEDPLNPQGLVRCIFAYENHQRLQLEQQQIVFPAGELLPPIFTHDQETFSLVVEPLFFREDHLGYAVFEADPHEEAIYEILGGQISVSLRRTILTQRNIHLFDEAIKARKAAEESNVLKSRFLSMVSHELRTPLSLIVGIIEMMLQEENNANVPHLPPAYRKDLDSIHSSAQHLFRLIGDVLDLASNQAGELKIASEPLDLGVILNEVAGLGRAMAREKGLEWREQIPNDVLMVKGDRTRLRQIALNLLSNAVKFTESGFIGLSAKSEQGHVIIEISDSGMGVPSSEQDAIFDEFRRSERSVARGYGGMGLGLSITGRLVELHGGQIGVRSTGLEETGSTFYFQLPLLNQAVPLKQPINKQKNKVLILSEKEAFELYDHLQAKGFDVEIVNCFHQSDWLQEIIAHTPGAVVLDFLPAAELGWQLMEVLKQHPQTSDVPVIFYNLEERNSQGSFLQIETLTKPVSGEELVLVLEKLGIASNDERPTILIVDDDPNVLDMHKRMLEKHISCYTVLAYNGKEALEILKRESPDLILLDLMMPEMDGFEVLQQMRSLDPVCTVPVIILSAKILTAEDMSRLQEGVAVVLGKGLFSMEEMLSRVEAVLNHSKHLGSQASQTVRQVMAYIHENYAESLSRSELARHVAITERYLTHCFRHEMGITPVTYLNRYRIKRAKLMLAQGRANITEVAMQVGFSDSSYFNRVFRQEVGMTPGNYQKKKKENRDLNTEWR